MENKTKEAEKMMRHGDVQLIRVDVIPADAVKKEGKRTLAEGEKTGHSHAVDLGELFETRDGVLYLKVHKEAKVSHEEHKTSPVKPGTYKVVIKRQYSAEKGWSKVVD